MAFTLLIFIFIFGLVIGSFLNCLIYRLKTGAGMWGRSYCPHCRKTIAWYDNFPVLSFILLEGKCRHCGEKISWQYPLVEVITGILFVLSFCLSLEFFGVGNFFDCRLPIADLRFAVEPKFLILNLRNWFVIATMIVIFVYDLRWYLILDKVTFPAGAVILVLNLFWGISWLNLFISAIIGGSFFLIQFIISRGRWIGGGDIRLGVLMGLTLGRWDYLLLAIFLAYLIGSLVGIILIVSGKKQWSSRLPLGVFLSLATVITVLAGDKLLTWYLGLF